MRTRSSRDLSPRLTVNPATDLRGEPSDSSSTSSLTWETGSMRRDDSSPPAHDAASPSSLHGGNDRNPGGGYPASDTSFHRATCSDDEHSAAWNAHPQEASDSPGQGTPEAAHRHTSRTRGPEAQSYQKATDPLTIGPSGLIELGKGGETGTTRPSLAATAYTPRQTRSKTSGRHASSTSHIKAESVKAEDVAEAIEGDFDGSSSESESGHKKVSPAFRPNGRKKRNKCSPEQLEALEAFFAKNRNPTGRVREELSKKLKMPERSVQVWFQNRRAKIKTLERQGLVPGSYTPPARRKRLEAKSDDSQKPASSAGSKTARVPNRAENPEQPSVTALPTTALCIGNWRRVTPLVCFFSRRLQMLSWYLSSDSIGFKLEMPWSSIRSCVFDGPTQPTMAERHEGIRHPLGHFMIELSRPPTFFMEVFPLMDASAEGSGATKRASWRQCADFTEAQQATSHRIHILSGPYEQLRQAVVTFAQCNEVLKKLVRFRDAERAEAGGSGGGGEMNQATTPFNGALQQHIGADLRVAVGSPMTHSDAALQGSVQRPHTADWPSSSAAGWQGYRTAALHEGTSPWEPQGSHEMMVSASHSSMGAYPIGTGGGFSVADDAHAPSLHTRQAFAPVDMNTLRLDPASMTALGPSRFDSGDGSAVAGGVGDQLRHETFHSLPSWGAQAPEESSPSGQPSQWHHQMQPFQSLGGVGGHYTPSGYAAEVRSYQLRPHMAIPHHEAAMAHVGPSSPTLDPAAASARRQRPMEELGGGNEDATRYTMGSYAMQDGQDGGFSQIHPALATSNEGLHRERTEEVLDEHRQNDRGERQEEHDQHGYGHDHQQRMHQYQAQPPRHFAQPRHHGEMGMNADEERAHAAYTSALERDRP
ncbi:hypothetical protein ACQY0O_008371 [Thecaphora frezii]